MQPKKTTQLTYQGTDSRKFSRLLAPALILLAASTAAPAADESAPKQDVRAERMEHMRERARRTVIRPLDAKPGEQAMLNPQPLFRYDDEPRSVLDATIWCWPAKGRPIALQKIERYKVQKGNPEWFFCVASFSQNLIEMTSSGGIRWASRKPGIELRELTDSPEPSASAIGRSVQLKNMARRFSSQMADPPINVVQQMRLLPRPLYRYSDPDSNIVDGAIFGFATNGVNPDLHVMIEIVNDDDSKATWRYGLARMTIAQLKVKLDETEVWSVPYVTPLAPGKIASFDTWAFSWEPLE